MKLRFLPGVFAILLATGCATSGNQAPPAQRRDLNFITAEEVRRSTASNAFDLVQALRPGWLRIRGLQSITDDGVIVVYHDHVRLGGLQTLRSIPVNAVETMHFLDAPSATQRQCHTALGDRP